MFAAPEPHPLSNTVLLIVLLAGIALLTGALFARRWHGTVATWVRGILIFIAVGVTVSFEIYAPSGGIEGAARLLTLWPLAVLAVIFFAIWTWRDHRRSVETSN
jgi:hypothetical protein